MCSFDQGVVEMLEASHDQRLTQKLIRIRIPKTLHQDPVISRLVSDYGLIVNIQAAVLGGNAEGDGWFALELRGTHTHIQNALAYLNELDLEMWDEREPDGW